ncbi:thiol peroxidase [Rapidithrix thailandica]|uniref:Thiol peroxidase n=1 Tax=Rapidithrix thailandica TaxID=413964 RepID=A0AAW9SA94_9BACT
MATITFKGNEIQTKDNLPQVGEQAPDFSLTKSDLSEVSLSDFEGKKLVLNIFPSIDTGICAASVRAFNEKAAGLPETVVLCISKDLPFAHKRFCEAEGLSNVVTLSEYKDDSFSAGYGVKMTNGPLAGLMSRAIVVVGQDGKVSYTEQVPEIVQEPDYEKALQAING